MPHQVRSKQDKELIRQLFLNGYFLYMHPGWLDETDLFIEGQSLFCENARSPSSFLGLRQILDQTFWIQYFGCEKYISDEILKSYISYIRRYHYGKINKLYAISDSNFFTNILGNNGFRLEDRIIQLSLFNVHEHTLPRITSEIEEITEQNILEIEMLCEISFPPLWRISEYELRKAYTSADIGFQIKCQNKTAAYILAAVQNENCHILRIAVAKPYQHQHLAEQLLSFVLSFAPKKSFISEFSVNTNETNVPALSLYQKFGFEAFGPSLSLLSRTFP